MRVLKAPSLAISLLAVAAISASAQDAPRQQDADISQELTRYFAKTLALANHDEIALSKIALDRTQNADLKQLAQTIVDDHSRLNHQLLQIVPSASTASRDTPSGKGERKTADFDSQCGQALARICEINRQAAENQLQQSRIMLGDYQGQDFDMAFLSMQIGDHSWLLAELQAITGVGTSGFQQIVQETMQKVQKHKQLATSLAKRLEDDRRTADRRQTPLGLIDGAWSALPAPFSKRILVCGRALVPR